MITQKIMYIAWDKLLQKILKVQELDFSDWWVQCKKPDGDLVVTPEDRRKYGERNSFENQPTDRHILLPYTGKNDCNGSELFESDLIELENQIYMVKLFMEGYYLFSVDDFPMTPLRCGCIKGKRVGSVYESEEYSKTFKIARQF